MVRVTKRRGTRRLPRETEREARRGGRGRDDRRGRGRVDPETCTTPSLAKERVGIGAASRTEMFTLSIPSASGCSERAPHMA